MIAIAQLKEIRLRIDQLVGGLSPERLFRVPEGFANHIAWNAAHLAVTQQLLHYSLSGLQPHLPAEIIERYRKGTGANTADEPSYRTAMEVFRRAPEQLETDFSDGKFTSFQPYETSAGIRLGSIEDAIVFNNFHEGIHLGYILALRKLV